MNFVAVYARLYAECLKRAFVGIGKNVWTLFVPMILVPILMSLAALLSEYGMVGGILISLLEAAVASCYLYVVSEVVSNSKVRVNEWPASIRVYFWPVIGVFFVLWIVDMIVNYMLGAGLRDNPNLGTILIGIMFLKFVLLNPIPEVLYTRGSSSGIDSISTAIRFIQENWIEWFVPNLPLGAAIFYFHGILAPQMSRPFQLLGYAVCGALVHVAMIFRGHLFNSLNGSTHRQRMFKYRRV